MATGLSVHVVYRNPSDLPGVPFAVRTWRVEGGRETPDAVVLPAPSLDAARAAITERAPTAVCIGRMSGDDPAIHEVWV